MGKQVAPKSKTENIPNVYNCEIIVRYRCNLEKKSQDQIKAGLQFAL